MTTPNKIIRIGPLALTNAAANIVNPGTTTGGVNVGTPQNLFLIVKKITVVNKTAAPHQVSLYIGATGGSAAGTEFEFNAFSIPANGYIDRYTNTPLDVADFLTGLADANAALTIQMDCEVGVR
jgi:hypothetical protein